MFRTTSFFLCLLSCSLLISDSFAQKNSKSNSSSPTYDKLLFNGLHWRCIGPFRGGRSLAVCGVTDQPNVYYFGAVGGGVWKTNDGGQSWRCISDSTFKSSSVGAITVAPSDPNVIYVGMGEAEMRGNISFGDGMYKSSDAGKTWKKIGLEKTYAIQNIIVHPTNPNLVYCSAMGEIFGANKERGVYRSKDGGSTWELILSKNDSTGAVDVKFDLTNPSTLYASLWQAYRTPYSLSSGGKGSGLYKSMDGGDHWTLLSQNPGMPKGLLGKITVTVSPVNGDRVWAMVENENGGLFRSDDGGKTWSRINTNNNLTQRPWYFSQIFADPKDFNTIYCLNVEFWKSIDGGNSFNTIGNRHGDNHDMWINPKNPSNFIIGDDGGGEVTFDGGAHFSELDFPTGQFYHVTVDNDFPYNVYGAQQDNSTIRIASRTTGWSIDANDWYPVAGFESGYVVPDPENPTITYGGNYDGFISKYNKENEQNQPINVYPENNIGHGSIDRKERFQWTFPIMISPFDPKTIYVTSQHVHRSKDGDNSWEIISPDLTRNDKVRQQPSGGPINKDNTGAEVYCTIFAFAESYIQQGMLWAGSDDGLIHCSTDNGKNWDNVTPPASLLPDWSLISIVEPSHYDAGTIYVAATRYKSDDTKPYLLKSTDFGKTWKLIVNGIASNAYTRVIREDPNRKGLLYAGTETGIYVSFNDGESWQSLQLNLPNTPVHDIQIQNREKDLVIATHGRAFWILDDLTPIYQLNDEIAKSNVYLFKPRPAYRMAGGSWSSPDMQSGENAPAGVIVHYYFKQKPKKEVTMKFFTDKGDTIVTYSSTKDRKGEPIKIQKDFYENQKVYRAGILPIDSGMNTFAWDMRWADPEYLDGALLWGNTSGPVALPGNYKVKLYIGDSLIMEQPFTIIMNPKVKVSTEDLQAQFDFIKKVNDKYAEVNKSVKKIRDIRNQLNSYIENFTDTLEVKDLKALSKPIIDSLTAIEEAFVQTKAKAFQDLLRYPIKLNNKIASLGGLAAGADARPPKQFYDSYNDIAGRIDVELNKLKDIIDNRISAFNKAAEDKKRPAVKIK